MPEWADEQHETIWEYETPQIEAWVTDNPIVGELLGPDGEPILTIYEREPIGFRMRED